MLCLGTSPSVSTREEPLILSTQEELGEFDLIRRPDHVKQVWGAIEAELPNYWEAFLRAESQKRQAPKATPKKASSDLKPEARVLAAVFDEAVTSYEKEAAPYRRF